MTVSIKANAAGTQGEVLLNGTPVQTFNQNTLQVSGNVLVGAAQSNEYHALTRKDYVDGLAAKQTVIFRANKTNGQALPAGAVTTILFNQVVFDTKSSYNASTGIYTIQESGLYLLVGRFRITQGTAQGEMSCGLDSAGAGVLDGGANIIDLALAANAQRIYNATQIAYLPAGSTVKATVYMENAGSITVAANPNTLMSISRVG